MNSPTRKIGDVAKVKGGKRLPKGMSVLDEVTEHPYLRVVDFRDGGIDRSGIKYIDSETFDCIKQYTIDSSDVYISIAGTIGRVGIVPDDLSGANLTENAAKITEISDDVDYRYLMYYLRGPVGQGAIKNRTGGTSQPKLALYKIADIDFPHRPLAAQRSIVSILAAYDDLIENNRRRIQLLELSARLLYREWFVHLRFPGHEHVKITDGMPEGWEKKTAFDVMEVLSGGTPKTKISAYWNGDIPFYRPKDAVDYAYMFETEKTITEDGLRNCNSSLYPKDTVFITARGTVGKINLAQTSMAMNQSCYALVAKPPVNQHYLYFAMVDAVEQFRSRAVGAVFDAVIRDTFKIIPFIVPDEKLIKLFTDYASPILNQIDVLATQIQKLSHARDLLLPRLMNGEIAV